MTKHINENDRLKEALIADLSDAIQPIEKNILDELFRIIDRYQTSEGVFTAGYLTADQLLELQSKINSVLNASGYSEKVGIFIQDFGKVTINTATLLEGGGYSFKKLPLSDIEKKWKNQTVETLLHSGLNEDFKRPVLKIIDDAITYGDSVESAKTKLVNYVLSGKDKSGKLSSYVTTTARDAISQMQGQQFQSVAREIGVSGILYTGGLLDDSRAQCVRWIDKLNGFIPVEKLEDEIALAYKNQRAKKVEGKHKWSGMMPDTNKDNFCIKRGGWGCIHTAIPKRKK